MNLVTLDSVIRSYLVEKGMVWHDYFRCLAISIAGYKKLCEDINLGSNVKAALLDVTNTGRLLMPSDAIDLIGVYIENGDKILPMSNSEDINPLVLKDNTGTPVKRGVQQDTTYYEVDYYYAASVNDKGSYVGRNFGNPTPQPYKYKRTGNEVQFDTRLNLDCVLVIYMTNGLGVTDQTMVHPMSEQAIKLYLDWKWTERGYKKGIWEKKNEESAFLNEKRLLYGRLNGLTWAEYMSTIREFRVNTAKY